MTNVRLIVNGDTLMDGDLGLWHDKPPTAIQHLIGPGRKVEPYMQAALGALLEAAMKEVDTTIEATTKPTGGWILEVTHSAAKIWVAT